MRIASFNVENFFGRAKALNTRSWAQGRPVLAAQAELNTVLNQDTYSPADKTRIITLLGILGLARSDSADLATLPQTTLPSTPTSTWRDLDLHHRQVPCEARAR